MRLLKYQARAPALAGARAWYSRRESNPQRPLRRGLLYPFNYGSVYYSVFYRKQAHLPAAGMCRRSSLGRTSVAFAQVLNRPQGAAARSVSRQEFSDIGYFTPFVQKKQGILQATCLQNSRHTNYVPSVRRYTDIDAALYKKFPPSPTTLNVDGVFVTVTGKAKDIVAESVAFWNVCCATAPGTTVPSFSNSTRMLRGSVSPDAGDTLL